MRIVSSVAIAAFVLALVPGCGQPNEPAVSDVFSAQSGATQCPNIAYQNPAISGLDLGVRNYAAARYGQQVGSGECSDLADYALRSLGAKTFSQLGPTGASAAYVWGNLVTTLSTARRVATSVLPGDIIQYVNFSQKVTNPNGSWWTSSASHHTSVVKAVAADGQSICVYEQNVNGRRTVGEGYVSLAGLQTGTLYVYRPRI